MRELPNMVRVLAAIAVLGAFGCGDDDGGEGDGDGRGPGRDGGLDGGSDGDEGWPCLEPDECNAELVCAGSPITVSGVPIGVCGRPCDADADCNGGRCISYTEEEADFHCVEVVGEEFALCGVADTSVCAEGTTCLYLPGAPVGVCVTLCSPEGGEGGDEDAGVAVGECSGDQTCIEDVVASGEGVCGTQVERGEECGIESGLFCGPGHICAPEDPRDETSTFRCFQDCSDGETTCDEGQCTLVQNLYAYCL